MNSLKTMLTAAIMVAGLYGVYILLNRTPDAATSPEIAQEWDNMKMGARSGGTGGVPNGNISPPTPRIDPGELDAIGAEQAFPSNTTTSYANSSQSGNPVGVPVAAGAPIGDQYNLDYNSTSETPLQGIESVSNSNPSANPDAIWQDTVQKVRRQLAENRLADAHLDLSRAYADPNTTPEKKKEIEPLLDQLAGTVVYSRQHLLEKPYKVTPNDTLEGIAQRYNVPVGLLAKINGLDPIAPLQPGKEMKVLQGPFSATVDLSDYLLTLTTSDGRYAGRFPVGVGPKASNITRSSVYMVTDKTDTSTYADQGQTKIGRRWIGLGEQLGLHGTDSPATIGTSNGTESISLDDRSIEDVYDILTVGSRVTIQP